MANADDLTFAEFEAKYGDLYNGPLFTPTLCTHRWVTEVWLAHIYDQVFTPVNSRPIEPADVFCLRCGVTADDGSVSSAARHS